MPQASTLAIMLVVLAALLGKVAGCLAGPNAPQCARDVDCSPGSTLCDEGFCKPCEELLPPPNTACLPRGGNELGVGQPCTAGGGECNRWFDVDGAFFCTIDFIAAPELRMCTRPCANASDCGSDAVCQGDPDDADSEDSEKSCVPTRCAADPVDAGVVDAGP